MVVIHDCCVSISMKILLLDLQELFPFFLSLELMIAFSRVEDI